MRIMLAVDDNPYSLDFVKEVSKIIFNTCADIIILGIDTRNSANLGQPQDLMELLLDYRDILLSAYKEDDECPYSRNRIEKIVEKKQGVYEGYVEGGLKECKLIVRSGIPHKEILQQANEDETDLIILGCNKKSSCQWDEQDVPLKVVNNALCSVLVVKENKSPENIVCCLDHDKISQNSLELINQMATVYNAELKLVGISNGDVLSLKVEKTMQQLFDYYTHRNITSWLEVVDRSILFAFINQAAQQDLVALWIGENSFLNRIFPHERVSHLLKNSHSSLLFLR
jgi:hypothetical protein